MASPKSVAFLLLSPVLAGVENVVFQIIKHIDRKEISPYLIVSSEISDHFSNLLPKENILVLPGIFYQPKNKYTRYVYPLLERKFKWKHKRIGKKLKKVNDFLSSHQIDLLHSHLLEDHLLCYYLKQKGSNLKMVFTIHGTLGMDPEDNYQTWLTPQETKDIIKCADAYTSACKYFEDLWQMYQIPRSNFTRIANGIDISLSDEVIARNSSKKMNSMVFLGGGRVQQKGGDLLIKSLYYLVHEFNRKDIQLSIYGNVPPNTKEHFLVKQLNLSEYVDFKGFVSPPKHLDEMLKHEVFVLPSRHEGVANSLMEAIGLGMKIVATDVGGTSEVLKDYEHGEIVPVNAQEFAKNLNMQLNTKKNLSLEFRNLFNWGEIIQQYTRFYLQLFKVDEP